MSGPILVITKQRQRAQNAGNSEGFGANPKKRVPINEVGSVNL